MSDELVLYYSMSRGRVVRWMLEEVGQPIGPSCWTTERR